MKTTLFRWPFRFLAIGSVWVAAAAELPTDTRFESVTVLGQPYSSLPPDELPQLHHVVALGVEHTFNAVVQADGQVLSWNSYQPDRALGEPAPEPIRAIALGESHVVGLTDSGTVLCWGSNQHGQTNAPPGLTNVISISAGGKHSVAIQSDGTLVGWGPASSQSPPAALSNIVLAAQGWVHGMALNTEGALIGWGTGTWGNLDPPPGLSNIVQLAMGERHSLALTEDGRVHAWGDNYATSPDGLGTVYVGQSVVPDGLDQVIAIAAGGSHSLALKTDGTVVGWGSDLFGQIGELSSMTDVVGIGAGFLHTMVLKRQNYLTRLSPVSPNRWKIEGLGHPFHDYEIQTRTNLTEGNWQSLGTVTADSLGGYSLKSTPTSSPQRLFRSID